MILTVSVICILFLIWFVILFNAVFIENSNPSNTYRSGNFNGFSIIIAAKNEEDHLSKLLNSLERLDYPLEHFEIILIDDNSIDNTYQIALAHSKSFSNIKIIKAGDKKLPAKKGALQIGYENAKFEYIVTTDADCEVPENWLIELNAKIESGFDVIIGNVKFAEKNGFWYNFFQIEQIKTRFLMFGLANLGLPYTSAGPNFCFKKEILDKMGGYGKISQILSGDDDLLLNEAGKMGYRITTGEFDNPVATAPPEGLNSFLKMKKRHTTTSNYYPLKTKIILFFWYSLNFISAFSIIPAIFYNQFIYLFLTKIFIDFMVITYSAKEIKTKIPAFLIIPFSLLGEYLIPIHYFRATFGKESW